MAYGHQSLSFASLTDVTSLQQACITNSSPGGSCILAGRSRETAEFTYNEAREKVFVKRLPPNTSTTTYPNASGRAYGFKFPKKSNLMLFRAEAQTSPELIKSRTSYGPIFIYGHKLSQEVILNTPGFVNIPGGREKIIAFSAVLPDWFVIYDTTKSYKGTEAPPVILQGGEIHHFIGR